MSLALKYTMRYRALFIFRLLNDARNRNNREIRAEFYDHTDHVSYTESDDGEGEGGIMCRCFFFKCHCSSIFVENEICSSSFEIPPVQQTKMDVTTGDLGWGVGGRA